jgi:hypothetical protein
MIVENTKRGIRGCGRSGVYFTPGVNVLSTEQAKAVKDDPSFAQLCKDGVLVVVKEKGSDEGGKLTAAELIAAIGSMNSVADIDKLREGESRTTVIAAIDKRIAELAAPPGDGEGGEGGEGGNGGGGE